MSLDFWENKRGDQSSLRTKEGGSLKTLEGFRREPLKFAWKMKAWWGDRESHQKSLGGITSLKKHSKADRLNFT